MTRPTSSGVLEAWEHGLGLPPAERCLALIVATDPGMSVDEAARLPIGERDARLLELREWAFGSAMTGTAKCPSCGVALELPVDIGEVRVRGGGPPGVEHALAIDGHEIRFRLPNSRDVRAASEAGSVDAARDVLLRRCVVSATHDGEAVAPDSLPDRVIARVEAAIADRNGQADVRLSLSCPDCEHDWQAEFDIGVFLWGEVDQWAHRLLVDVATLAAAFGWTEDQVIELGPARREAYLELAAR